MRSPCALLVILACSACASPLAGLIADQAKGNEIQTAAVPTGDGAKYVSVTSEDAVAAALLRGRWKREAERTCEGDYLVLSETSSQRRTQGRASGTMHEGFVRCVSPEGTLADEDKPATDGGRTTPAGARRM
jgi:hypothetical protein